MLSLMAIVATLGTLSQTAFAAPDIRLGHPGYGGTGCPQGSASATLSPDRKSLSILFDTYVAEAGDSVGKSIDRKTCNIAVPVTVPQGYSISVFKVDYRGYVSVPRGGQARFDVKYFFAGKPGVAYRKTFRGGSDQDYLLSNNIGVRALVWSACGAKTNLRINSSMLARANRQRDDVLATVDSADIKAGMVYHIQWKRCRR